MSADATSAPRFDRAVVYVDFSGFTSASHGDGNAAAALLKCVQSSAAATASELVVVDVDAIPSSHSATAPATTSSTLRLLQQWQAEEADVYAREVHNTVPFMRNWECLVTCHDTANGAVIYALHRRQMPVLALLPPSASPHCTQATRPCSAVEALLHTCVPPAASLPEQEAAIACFFAFPAVCGTYVQTSAEAVTAATASNPAAEMVVSVNRDGYPVKLPLSIAQQRTLLPPPPTRFAGALEKLHTSSTAQMAELRRRNPLLPCVLTALHRYSNRGLLRCLLHRGYRVEMIESAAEEDRGRSSAAEQVRVCVALGMSDGDGPEALARKQATAAADLRNFESKWLEMPMPLSQS